MSFGIQLDNSQSSKYTILRISKDSYVLTDDDLKYLFNSIVEIWNKRSNAKWDEFSKEISAIREKQ